MNWIDAILSRIADLWPWTRTKMWQRAVRTTFVPFRDAVITVIGPGRIVRSLPWFDTVEIRDVQEDSRNLPTQSITTQDGKSVSFSSNFFYEIDDVQKAIFNVREFTSTLQDLAMVHMAERLRELTWEAARSDQRALERSLKGTLETRAKGWGVTITRVGITDFVSAKQLRIFGELDTL